MNLLNNDTVFIFTHVPKTAGTSLRYHFQKHLKDQAEFIHLANKGHKIAVEQGLLPFAERTESERHQAKVILGHDVNINTPALIAPKTAVKIVYFRDPAAWEISRYNQYANAKNFRDLPYLDFAGWLEHESLHSQFDWFLRHYCLLTQIPTEPTEKMDVLFEQLDQMDLVGFVDHINQDMIPIFEQLDIPLTMHAENVTGKYKKQHLFQDNTANRGLLKQKIANEFKFFSEIQKKYDRK